MRAIGVMCIVTAVSLVAPAIASAAELRAGVDSAGRSVTTYNAKAGEVNHPAFRAGSGGGAVFREVVFLGDDSAPVSLGPGCTIGIPVLCGVPDAANDIDIQLGNLADRTRFSSFSGDVTADGGDGDDDIRGDAQNATAYGRSGNDTIRLTGDFNMYAYGGGGNDRLHGGAFNHLFGEGGDDLIAVSGFGTPAEASGGGGNDRIVMSATGGGTRFFGDGGDDLLVIAPEQSGTQLNGGDGNDFISAGWSRNVVDGGSGHDLIDVIDRDPDASPGLNDDEVACGSGYDIVWADSTDTVAGDCEVQMGAPAPALPGVTDAIADAAALRTEP